MDELKKYLKEHEPFMEVEMPDEKSIWQRIESSEREKAPGRNQVVNFIRYAAVACVLIVIGFGLIRLNKNDTKPADLPIVVKKNKSVSKDTLRSIDKQLVSARVMKKKAKPVINIQPAKKVLKPEDDYEQLVNYQLKRLRTIPVYAEDPAYFTDFKIQLQQMDKDEASLRNDMKLYGLNDQLLDQLINIYQQKLNLLKTLRGEINKMNNKVKEKQSSPYYLNI